MKSIPMNVNLQAAMELQRAAFTSKFGREPGPDDPILFDPDYDVPTPFTPAKLTEIMARAMAEAGMDPAKIYAFRKTGIILTKENADNVSNRDKKRWRRAIQDFQRGITEGGGE